MFMYLTACHDSSAMVLFTPITTLLEHSAAQQEWSQLLLRRPQVLDKTKNKIIVSLHITHIKAIIEIAELLEVLNIWCSKISSS